MEIGPNKQKFMFADEQKKQVRPRIFEVGSPAPGTSPPPFVFVGGRAAVPAQLQGCLPPRRPTPCPNPVAQFLLFQGFLPLANPARALLISSFIPFLWSDSSCIPGSTGVA